MKLVSALVAILMIAGCTTMKAVEMTPDELQEQISTGQILSEGEMVNIVTADERTHEFRVSTITDKSIIGSDIDVPVEISIADIVAIETTEFSGGKTAALAGGMAGGVLLVAAVLMLTIGI